MNPSVWWKEDQLSNSQKIEPKKLVPGKEYILMYENLYYTGIFLHSHTQYPKYNFFIIDGKKQMVGPAFSHYDVGKLLISYFDEITQLLPADLLCHIESFL